MLLTLRMCWQHQKQLNSFKAEQINKGKLTVIVAVNILIVQMQTNSMIFSPERVNLEPVVNSFSLLHFLLL